MFGILHVPQSTVQGKSRVTPALLLILVVRDSYIFPYVSRIGSIHIVFFNAC